MTRDHGRLGAQRRGGRLTGRPSPVWRRVALDERHERGVEVGLRRAGLAQQLVGVPMNTSSPADNTPTTSQLAASPTYCVVTINVRPASRSVPEPLPEARPQDRVDAGGRLVEEGDGRVVDERRGEGQAALHASRCFTDPLASILRQLHPLEQLAQARRGGADAARTSKRGSSGSPTATGRGTAPGSAGGSRSGCVGGGSARWPACRPPRRDRSSVRAGRSAAAPSSSCRSHSDR